MNKKLLLIGGGGHCKSVIDCLRGANPFDEIGVIDMKENIGKEISDIRIIGCDDDLSGLFEYGYHYAFITLGSIGNPTRRRMLFSILEDIGYVIPNIIDPSAILGANVNIGTGVFIGKNVVVNVDTSIGKGSIINTSVTIEHDCRIKDFVHIAPGSTLCGSVEIGESTHIGAGTVVKQEVKIGNNTMIGMGSVVLHNVGDSVLAFGNPCREVKKL